MRRSPRWRARHSSLGAAVASGRTADATFRSHVLVRRVLSPGRPS
jgi:hypothetical protein